MMSEDEKEDDDDNEERQKKTSECLEYDEKYWFEVFASQTARSQSSGAWRREGTREEREAAAELKRTHRVKNLFKTHDEYAIVFAEATLEVSKIEFGKKMDKAREIVRMKLTDHDGNAQVTPKHLVAMAYSNPGEKPRPQGTPHLTE